MANGRFLLWLKNVLKINTVPGYSGDYDKTRGDSVFIDNSNRVMEVNNLQEGLTPTQYHGQKASVLEGSSQYWQLSLPDDKAVFDLTALSHGSTSLPTGWTKQAPATTVVKTDVIGSSKCVEVLFGSNTGFYRAGILTIGKKYKVSFRYKANYFFRIGSLTAVYRQPNATAEWNNISFVFTADSSNFYIRGEGAYYAWIESLIIKEDQGLDANQDQERILHSKNAEFERILGAELSSGSVTIGKKYVVTLGVVEGNVTGAEFLATTNSTTLNSNNKVKEIPNLFTNGTLVDGTNWLREEPATQTFADGVCHFINTTLNYSIYADTVNRKLITGRRYRLSLQILNFVSGGLKTGGTGVPISPAFTANGVHTFDFTYSGSNGALYISASSAGTTLDFDNIHCYEIPEWSPSFAPVSGNNHYCDISTLDKAAGTQSQRITATGAGRGAELVTNPTISGSANGWTITVPATVAYGNDNLVCTNLNNSSTLKPTGVIVTTGKIYEVIFTITVTSGNIAFVSGVGATGRTNKTVSGTYREVQTCVNSGDFYIDGTNFYGTIESLYVKEFLGEITLPAINLEPLVAGKKYTLEGKARLDPASLSYGANLLSGDGTSEWNVGNGTGGVVSDEYVLSSIGTGYLFRSVNSPNNILKVTFKAKADTYTGKIDVYQQSNTGIYAASTPNLTSTYQTFILYLIARSTQQTFYIQLQSTHTGNIYFDDITIQAATPVTITQQIGTKSVNSGALSIVPGSFTKFVVNFEATTSEVNADLKSYLSGQGSVFVDGISLTQAYDIWISQKFKPSFGNYSGYLLSMYNTNNGGINIYKDSSNFCNVRVYDNTNSYLANPTNTISVVENYQNVTIMVTNTDLKIYMNGSLLNTINISVLGKKSSAGIRLGYSLEGGGTRYAGQLATVQIIRFDNISKTNFNPNTYQSGDAITDNGGGVPEVVLWQDWSNIVGAIAMDKYRPETTRRNDLTAYGSPLASGNMVMVKDYSPQTKKLRQGTQSKQPIYSSVEGFDFDGTDDILEAGASLGSIKTIVLKLKADNLELAQDILQLSAAAKLTLNTDGTITATGWTSPTVKIQNTLLADSVITPNNDFLVAVKSSTAITTDAFKLGGSTTFLNGKIRKIALFTTELDDPTIQKIFKSIRSI